MRLVIVILKIYFLISFTSIFAADKEDLLNNKSSRYFNCLACMPTVDPAPIITTFPKATPNLKPKGELIHEVNKPNQTLFINKDTSNKLNK